MNVQYKLVAGSWIEGEDKRWMNPFIGSKDHSPEKKNIQTDFHYAANKLRDVFTGISAL